jgi:4-amino-4-deoxy-L-arabinose transferase-like glycosyltransferase
VKWPRPRVRLLLCALLTALVYLPGLGRPALWEPDEGRYAEIGREMLLRADFITPRDDWVRYFEKPPLMYWVTAASIRLLGTNETAVRLPVALASIAQVVITMALAQQMFDPLTGVLAALCLALSPIFFGFSRFLTLDPPLAFSIAAALFIFYRAVDELPAPAARRKLYLAAVMVAVGTLIKGPVALVLVCAVAGSYLLSSGRGQRLRQIPWLGCAILYLGLTLPWFVLVARRNPGFVRFFLVHEHLQRYAVSTEHAWGPYFFILVILAGMWPWIAFAPAAFGAQPSPSDRSKPAAVLFNVLWFGVVLIFFSIPRSKLGSYILPALPPLAILAGLGLSRLVRGPLTRLRWWFGGIALVDAIVAVAALLVVPKMAEARSFPALLVDLRIGLIGAVGGSLLATLTCWPSRRAWPAEIKPARPGRALIATALLGLGIAVALGAAMKARQDGAPLESYRGLARQIAAAKLGSDCVLASYRHIEQSLPFYLRQREVLVGFRGELAPFSSSSDAKASFLDNDSALAALWHSGRCVVLVINRRDLSRVLPQLGPPARPVAIEGEKIALVNRK